AAIGLSTHRQRARNVGADEVAGDQRARSTGELDARAVMVDDVVVADHVASARYYPADRIVAGSLPDDDAAPVAQGIAAGIDAPGPGFIQADNVSLDPIGRCAHADNGNAIALVRMGAVAGDDVIAANNVAGGGAGRAGKTANRVIRGPAVNEHAAVHIL